MTAYHEKVHSLLAVVSKSVSPNVLGENKIMSKLPVLYGDIAGQCPSAPILRSNVTTHIHIE
jgi:hypothetical protein